MARKRESSSALLKFDHDHWHHAGQEEGSMSESSRGGQGPSTVMKFFWTAASIIALCGVAAALTVAAVGFVKYENHAKTRINAVCNWGANTGLDLPQCPNAVDVPGYPLLSGDPSDPNTVFVSRLSKGPGVQVTQTPNSNLEVAALIESLTPALVIGVSPAPAQAVTIDFDAALFNFSDACNISCNQNFFVNVLNGGSGYGLAMGTDHTFANDATHKAAAILSGWNNALIASGGSVVVGGRYNMINGTFCSFIGAGRNNTVLSPRSGIVIGEYNLMDSNHSFIGSGQLHTIQSALEGNAIISGESNDILGASRSIIGAGFNCLIQDSDDSGIYSGKENQIINSTSSIIGAGTANIVNQSTSCIVGAGTDNLMSNCTSTGIMSGSLNNATRATRGFIGGGELNVIVDSVSAVIGSGLNSSIDTGSDNSGIVSGEYCSITNGAASFIGAGLYMTLVGAQRSFLGAGYANTIDVTNQPDNAIVAGRGNSILGASTTCFIGSGTFNTIGSSSSGTVVTSAIITGYNNQILPLGGTNTYQNLIGAGLANKVENSFRVMIGAGYENIINNGAESMIGAGDTNLIQATSAGVSTLYFAAIVAGSQNSIIANMSTGVSQASFIGSGQSNTIYNAWASAILAGMTNSISGKTGSSLFRNTAIIAGTNNVIETTTGGSYVSRSSLIGVGTGNRISSSEYSVVVSGSSNTIGNSSNVFIGSGTSNGVSGLSVSVFIGAGTTNTITNNSWSAIVAGDSNSIESTTAAPFATGWNFIGAGHRLDIQDSAYCANVAGHVSGFGNSTRGFIGSGEFNYIQESSDSAIVAGYNNYIFVGKTNNNGGNFIGAGVVNYIQLSGTGGPDVVNNCIVSGADNIVENSQLSFIGSGSSVFVNRSSGCAAVAGTLNKLEFQTYSLIGAGTSNVITAPAGGSGSYNAIVAGATNTITGDINYAFMGAAQSSFINGLDTAHYTTGFAFIGVGFDNHIIDSTNSIIGVGRSAIVQGSIGCGIVNGNYSTILTSEHSFIGSSLNGYITSSDGAFIGASLNSSIIDADYSSVISGRDMRVNGALDVSTAHGRHVNVLETFRTPGIQVIATDLNVVLGDHLFLADGVAATLNLGDSTTTPDGMQIRVRDIGDVSINNIILSCAVSNCIVCPPSAACSAAGGTDTMNVQYDTRFYVFRASVNTWYAY